MPNCGPEPAPDPKEAGPGPDPKAGAAPKGPAAAEPNGVDDDAAAVPLPKPKAGAEGPDGAPLEKGAAAGADAPKENAFPPDAAAPAPKGVDAAEEPNAPLPVAAKAGADADGALGVEPKGPVGAGGLAGAAAFEVNWNPCTVVLGLKLEGKEDEDPNGLDDAFASEPEPNPDVLEPNGFPVAGADDELADCPNDVAPNVVAGAENGPAEAAFAGSVAVLAGPLCDLKEKTSCVTAEMFVPKATLFAGDGRAAAGLGSEATGLAGAEAGTGASGFVAAAAVESGAGLEDSSLAQEAGFVDAGNAKAAEAASPGFTAPNENPGVDF